MLDVKRLRILREVAAQASFSGAAEALYLSQSAVSQQVATLEREVGMPLLARGNGGPRLTDAGEALLAHADAVIARLEEAERELAAISGLEAGRVRLASFPSASATLVTQALSEFRARFGGVALQFSEYEPEESMPLLRRGELDLVVGFDYPRFATEIERDLDRSVLMTESMHAALPRSHPLAGAPTVELAELAGEPWLCGTRPSSCADVVIFACRDAGFEPRIDFESDDYTVLQGFVTAGLGVTLLPDLALASLNPDVAILPIEPEPPLRRVWAATRAPGSRSRATEAMVELLEAQGRRLSGEASRAAAAARPSRGRAARKRPVPA
jgi:DNA-binding transcriptional LysR family regulator